MGAIGVHHTDTVDKPWDGPAAKANLKNDGTEAYYRSAFAWQDPDGDPTKKSSYKFIHHEVSAGGEVGPANLRACSAGIAVLNGGRGGADIPDADRKGVWSHLGGHLRDAGRDVPELASMGVRAAPMVEHRIFGSSIRVVERRQEDISNAVPRQGITGEGDGAGGAMPQKQACRLGGYAARFNTRSLPLGMFGFREEIDPHAFDESLAKNPDVRFTFNHEPSRIYGRTRAGTLQVSRDDEGLVFEVELPDTDEAESLATAVRRGDISQCSFAFRTLDDDWSIEDDGTMVRRLLKLDINNGDVAAVTFPAYPETEVEARATMARGQARLGREAWRRAAAGRARALALAECEI